MEATGILNTKIRDIGPGNENLFLKGIIVRNQEPKLIQVKRDNSERCVWNFTLRDSPTDMININAWGSIAYMQTLSSKWKIGDIVDVLNVKAVFRKISNSDNFYEPAVRSSFSASFSEGQSDIRKAFSNIDDLIPLMHVPPKSVDFVVLIADIHSIHSYEEKLKKQHVDILAAIRNIGTKRQFVTKDDRNVSCKDLVLTDQTCSTITLTIWNEDLINLSEKWIQPNTVLFLIDVRVEWNEYRKVNALSTTRRTIIIENPLIERADNLKQFLTSTPLQAAGKLDQILDKYADLSVINTVMSCANVILKSRNERRSTEFTALIYALLNHFNIDGSDSFLTIKCMQCLWKVNSSSELCSNANCPSGAGNMPPHFEQVYDIRVSLTDHTGLLANCKLTNEVAIKMIGCEAVNFHNLSEEDKTNIKWKYLLKYCAVKLVALPISGRDMPIITIVSLDVIPLSQYSSLIPMY